MILNPEPHFRPVSSRPADSGNPTNAVRPRSSRGESSNPVHLPLRSTPISAPTDPGSENPPPNPEPRPKNKQRIHVTVSETHGETITALRLTSGGAVQLNPQRLMTQIRGFAAALPRQRLHRRTRPDLNSRAEPENED